MCTNYVPGRKDLMREQLAMPEPTFDYRAETWPGYSAPMLLLESEANEVQWREAVFGLIPFWAKDEKISRQTYNARSETVDTKPSYRLSWKKSRYCLVPMQCFFEPNYASGRAVRWRIERADARMFTVAGIWDYWRKPDDSGLHSFSLLTINADGHPVMGQFHKPGDEKRSLVVVAPDDRLEWLRATPEIASTMLLPMPVQEFTSGVAPLPARTATQPVIDR